MRILFHSNQISERGTEVALFDYAFGNEKILNGTSYIAVRKDRILDSGVFEHFKKHFAICLYEDKNDIDTYISENNIDVLYQILSGDSYELVTESIPSLVHAVFSTRKKQGSLFCPISDYLNQYYKTDYPVLPHIVKKFPGTTKDLRSSLGIPKEATVFASYAGKNQFNIPFVHKAVENTAANNTSCYFLFMNIEPFIKTKRENIIFLEKNTSLEYKEQFINSSDAMLHARDDGETFGLSIAEFSVKNKPIISWKPDYIHNFSYKIEEHIRRLRGKKHRYAEAHLDFLGKSALTYSNYSTLYTLLNSFDKEKYKNKNNDRYSERFSPEKIMLKFDTLMQRLV